MRSLAAAALLAALAALAAAAARTHSYPRSGGYSGHGSHTYPHSNTGNSYPRTNTIPNTGYHAQNTRNHGYPPTYGLSGTGGSNTQHSSTGNWGSSNNWNSDHSRTSNNHVNNNYHSTKHTTVYKNEVHNHYVYHPPQQIQYGNSYHPVFHGQPPVYVYQYRESGSRFDHLLTGLALYNLGKMSSHHHHHYDDYNGGYNNNYYSPQSYHTRPGESCFIRVEKPDGQYDEGRIDCQIVTSFILDSPTDTTNVNMNNDPQTVVNKVTTTNVVTNVVTSNDQAVNGPITTVNTTNVTTVTTVDALSEKGPSINVTPSMKCFVIHNLGTRRSKHLVDCGLLTAYADNSMRSGTTKLLPKGSIIIVAVLIFRIL